MLIFWIEAPAGALEILCSSQQDTPNELHVQISHLLHITDTATRLEEGVVRHQTQARDVEGQAIQQLSLTAWMSRPV